VQQRQNRELRDGGGDAFSAAFEMIATPALFGLLGWYIDGRLGVYPIVTLVFIGITLAYEVWKLWANYSAQMDAALEERRAGYHRPPGTTGEVAP
jgi:hypothetical protein